MSELEARREKKARLADSTPVQILKLYYGPPKGEWPRAKYLSIINSLIAATSEGVMRPLEYAADKVKENNKLCECAELMMRVVERRMLEPTLPVSKDEERDLLDCTEFYFDKGSVIDDITMALIIESSFWDAMRCDLNIRKISIEQEGEG